MPGRTVLPLDSIGSGFEALGLLVKVQDTCLLHDVPRCTAGYHKKSSSANPSKTSPHSTVYRRDQPAYSYIR